jgi:hypothetical protein
VFINLLDLLLLMLITSCVVFDISLHVFIFSCCKCCSHISPVPIVTVIITIIIVVAHTHTPFNHLICL